MPMVSVLVKDNKRNALLAKKNGVSNGKRISLTRHCQMKFPTIIPKIIIDLLKVIYESLNIFIIARWVISRKNYGVKMKENNVAKMDKKMKFGTNVWQKMTQMLWIYQLRQKLDHKFCMWSLFN